jgi:hypothetical protein
MILRATKVSWVVAALLAGCAADAPTGASGSAIVLPIGKVPPIIVPDGDPFGSRFEVNGSTTPSAVTATSYVTLAIVGGNGVTGAELFDNGAFIGEVTAPGQVFELLVDESSNGNHAYSATVFAGTTTAPSTSIELTIAIHGGAQVGSYTTFGGLGLTQGQFNAVTTRAADDSIVAVGQILHGGYNAALLVDFNPANSGLDLKQDSRESAWTAVAVDPRTGYRALAGWANNGGQRDLVVSMQGPSLLSGLPTSEKFHVEYNAANLDDEANAIAVSARDGSVVVAGFETRPGEGRNGWITKYDAGGTSLWTQIIADSNNGDDAVTSLALNPFDDSIIIGGYQQARVTILSGGRRKGGWGQVGFVSKYTAYGVLVWSWTDKEPIFDGDGMIQSVALSTGSAGDIAFAGQMSSPNAGKLNSAGELQWRVTPAAPMPVLGVSIDPIGAVYINESVGPTPAGPPGVITLYPPQRWEKYSSAGALLVQAAGAVGYAQMLDMSASPPRYLIAGASYGVPFVSAFAP